MGPLGQVTTVEGVVGVRFFSSKGGSTSDSVGEVMISFIINGAGTDSEAITDVEDSFVSKEECRATLLAAQKSGSPPRFREDLNASSPGHCSSRSGLRREGRIFNTI